MQNVQPYNRQVEVIVGPLPEWKGGGDPNAAARFYGDGTPDNLRISFRVQKHIISTSSPSTIEIYNLGVGTRNALRQAGAKIIIRAGWENTGMIQIFSGSLLASKTKRQGADLITTLISLSNWAGVTRGVASETFGKGGRLKDAVLALAKTIQAVSVDVKNINVPEVFFGTGGFSFAGMAADGLDKLARSHGFSWWVDNGVFFALDDKKTFAGAAIVISPDNGFLLRAEPMLASPFQKQAGVSVHCLFNPYLNPGRTLELKSNLNPNLSGSYKIHTLEHAGDTHARDWTTSTQTWLVL